MKLICVLKFSRVSLSSQVYFNDKTNVYDFYFYFLKFIYFEQGRGRERGRQGIPSRLLTASTEPDTGLDLMNREIMTWAEIKSRMLNGLSHPAALMCMIFKASGFTSEAETQNIAVPPNNIIYDGDFALCLART